MYATKEAVLAREHDPQTRTHVFLMDMRAFSKGYEAYYRRAREQHGVEYTRCRVSEVREEPASGNLILRYVPEISGQWPVPSRMRSAMAGGRSKTRRAERSRSAP